MDQNRDDKLDQSRRRFLDAAAKIAVYVPPAMAMMSAPGLAAAHSGGRGGGNPPKPRKPKRRRHRSNSSGRHD